VGAKTAGGGSTAAGGPPRGLGRLDGQSRVRRAGDHERSAPEARSAFSESQIQFLQAEATKAFARLSRSYEAQTGKRYDPARCEGSN
jgi:hypothetical protein